MKKIIFILVSVFLFKGAVFSQGYGNTMVFGYGGGSISPNNDEYGLNIFTFTNGGLEISDDQESELEFNDTDAAISDDNGNLLFYFNGVSVYDASHYVMENGDTLNEFNQFGYDLPQGGIIVPYPEHIDKYLLFYSEEGYHAPWGNANVAVYYAVIDMTLNNGLGAVIQREALVVADSLEYGKLDLVRHANGRDWWLAIGEAHHNAFYRVLIDPYGVHLIGKQSIGATRSYGIGQSCFSRDGTKYVMFTSIHYGGEYYYLDIYDFDRCTGLFSNHEHIHINSSGGGGGAMIAPNSRWLYISLHDFVYKYDLWASPVEPTQTLIATYEPFDDPFPTKFHRGFLAPDDKIYIVTTSGSRTLHVVHKPDEPYTDCAFEQHGIRLSCYNGVSIPTFANYRLGPLDGSACDSLGINNVPVSWWRYEQDTVQHARFEFRDLSYHEPETWFWDFGDGSTSAERHPIHDYATSGSYQVCLTVSNGHGSDVLCRGLSATVGVGELPLYKRLRAVVFPNPAQDAFTIQVQGAAPDALLRVQVVSLNGAVVRDKSVRNGQILSHALAPGLYFCRVYEAERLIGTVKFIVIP